MQLPSLDLGHTLRALGSMPHILFGGTPAERAGAERLAYHQLGLPLGGLFRMESDTFEDGRILPIQHTVDGADIPPGLRWFDLPAGTRALALLVEDPDAPTPAPFVHWLVHGIDPTCATLPEALRKGAHEGRNSMLRTGWTGAAPPKGDVPHRYVFELFALDAPLELGAHAGRSALLRAMKDHVRGCTTLTGMYER